MEASTLFSGAVVAGHTYTSKPMFNGVRQHIFDGEHVFTGGSVAGTLYVDRSTSARDKILRDQGGDNVTDVATWRQYKLLYDKSGAQFDSVTISAAIADFLTLKNVGASAIRFRFVCSGGGNWDQTGSSREV